MRDPRNLAVRSFASSGQRFDVLSIDPCEGQSVGRDEIGLMILLFTGAQGLATILARADTLSSQGAEPESGFSGWLLTLEPLGWFFGILGVVLPLLGVFFRRPLALFWSATPWMETKRLNELNSAMTLSDFESTVRAKQAGSRDFAALGLDNSANLTSKLYILPRTYVEAFVQPNDDVYGYSIMLRRPSWLGAIKVSHYKVKLGRTTFRKLERRTIVTPTQRGFAYFEVEPSAKWNTYKGFAAGMSTGNAEGKALSSYLLAFPLVAKAIGRVRSVREECRNFEEQMERGSISIRNHYNLEGDQVVHTHPDFEGNRDFELWRNNTQINYVSVAHFGNVLLNMINCHGDLLQNFDYRDWPQKARQARRQARFRGYTRLIDYLAAKP